MFLAVLISVQIIDTRQLRFFFCILLIKPVSMLPEIFAGSTQTITCNECLILLTVTKRVVLFYKTLKLIQVAIGPSHLIVSSDGLKIK